MGSATRDIVLGEHVHLHNMKSNYLPTYTLEKEGSPCACGTAEPVPFVRQRDSKACVI
jgi:hypothetical protein